MRGNEKCIFLVMNGDNVHSREVSFISQESLSQFKDWFPLPLSRVRFELELTIVAASPTLTEGESWLELYSDIATVKLMVRGQESQLELTQQRP